ncbi:MAG TPA: hypothetical protein VMZ33_07750 [Candidatus Limnocylindrales bacterium]|nr:hypothetical protein [Candidatus Limnocylindrales bacterium]
MDAYVVGLRAVHIVAAASWVGASLSFAFFIEPVANRLGPSASQFMIELTERRKFPVAIAVVSVLAIVAGMLLYWRDSSGLEWAWISTRTGAMFTAGAVAALSAWLVGFLILRPGIARTAALAAAAPTDPTAQDELARLGHRLRTASLVNAWLIILATLAMATARYV